MAMRLILERILSDNSHRVEGYVISVAKINLEDFDPTVAAYYVALSSNLDSSNIEYQCGTPHASEFSPQANPLHFVEHSMGRIACHQSKNTDFETAVTKWRPVRPNEAAIAIASSGDDPTETSIAIIKGVKIANQAFRMLGKVAVQQARSV